MLAGLNKMLRWCAIFVISAFVLIFAANNHEAVTLSLFPLPYELRTRIFLLALISFACGVICGSLLMSLRALQTRAQMHHYRKRISALENEIAGMQGNQCSSGPASLQLRAPGI